MTGPETIPLTLPADRASALAETVKHLACRGLGSGEPKHPPFPDEEQPQAAQAITTLPYAQATAGFGPR